MPLTLSLPLPPNLGNARMHWRVKNKERKAYNAACDQRQALGLLPAPPVRAMERAKLSATMYVGAKNDLDNMFARCKWALDWLVTRGYLEDDREDCVEWTAFPRQIVKRGQEYRIVLTLEDAA